MEAWDAALAEGWEPMLAPAELIEDLMRPQVIRQTRRGEVTWAGQRYFLDALRVFTGEEILLAYDVRDASRVWVRTLEGELLGEALIDGNASDYMPKTMIEQAIEKRSQGQVKRGIDKIETLTGTRVEMIAPSAAPSAQLSAEQLAAARQYAIDLAPPVIDFQLPGDSVARYRLWKQLEVRVQAGEALPAAEARWHAHYPSREEWKTMKSLFDADPSQQARA